MLGKGELRHIRIFRGLLGHTSIQSGECQSKSGQEPPPPPAGARRQIFIEKKASKARK